MWRFKIYIGIGFYFTLFYFIKKKKIYQLLRILV